MKNKILLIIVIALSFIAIQSSFKEPETTFFNEQQVTIYNPDEQTSNTLNLEEYVIGVVAAEMPASFEEEALKAQAIASRTYAMYKINTSNNSYDLLTNISDQAYIDEEQMKEKWQEEYEYYYNVIKEAVTSTNNLIMTHDGEAICAFYFAISNGYTEEASLVFGEQQSYLESVDSSWDKNVNKFDVTTTIPREDFCRLLEIDCTSITINNIEKSSTGRVNNITVNNKNFKGTDFRKLLNLRSTDFTITINKDEILINTKGYGHGVGMSQYGANEMAKAGYTYEEILNYYYQNIKIEQINV